MNKKMKSPWPKFFLIVAIIVLLLIFVAPKVYEIFKDNIDDTSLRANNS